MLLLLLFSLIAEGLLQNCTDVYGLGCGQVLVGHPHGKEFEQVVHLHRAVVLRSLRYLVLVVSLTNYFFT